MVCQMPFTDKRHLFAASSVENDDRARQEVQAWAREQGYETPEVERTFTIFRTDALPREWVLLERNLMSN